MKKQRKRVLKRRSSLRRKGLAGVGLLAAGGLAGAVAAAPASASTSAAPPMADPTSIWDGGGFDYTFGTSMGGYNACGAVAFNYWNVPYIKSPTASGPGSTLSNRCLAGDAMPSGAGAWASGSDIWAPSVVLWKGRYIMHYAALKAGTGQRCIGRASSATINGPYTGQAEFACPGAGRWALDPYTFTSGGSLYLTYRDDAVTTGNATGISIVKLNDDGSANWATRVTAFLSGDVTWNYASRTNTDIVENPAVVPYSDGHFYLFYSGNDFQGNAYSTGIADCGTTPLPTTRCKTLTAGNADHPYFGYSASGLGPLRTLPDNHPGAAALSPYKTADGWRTPWAWWNAANSQRYVENNEIGIDSIGYWTVP